MDSVGRETAGGGWDERRDEIGRGDGNEMLNARSKPDDTDATKLLFGGDAKARKGQAIERMGRIGDLNLLGWGTLMLTGVLCCVVFNHATSVSAQRSGSRSTG